MSRLRKALLKRTIASFGLVAAVVPLTATEGGIAGASQDQPNIIFILTDDQDDNTLQRMPNVRSLIQAPGTTFANGIISNPLCCPSRTAIATGLYSHDNGVYHNGKAGTPDSAPWGGWTGFEANAHGDGAPNQARTLAYFLDQAGYSTGLFGKYLNGYEGSAIPLGWDRWFAFADGESNAYRDSVIDDDGDVRPRNGYSDRLAGDQAVAFAEGSAPSEQPFFIYYAPRSPHTPRTPQHQFRNVTSPRSFTSGAYNEVDVSDKPGYIRSLPRLTEGQERRAQERYDEQYACLKTVDHYVHELVNTLPSEELDNTVMVFVSDNGFAWGDHRWSAKSVPYERSINVPFIIRFDGVDGPSAVNEVVSNVDLAPTLLDLAGVDVPTMFDGVSIEPLLDGSATSLDRPGVLLEHKAEPGVSHGVPTYCGIREDGWKFVRYSTGFDEVYNLGRDRNELLNVAGRSPARDAALSSDADAEGCSTFWSRVA